VSEKFTKAEVGYGPGNGTVRCYLCIHYSNRTCDIVEGRIKPDDACRKFERAR